MSSSEKKKCSSVLKLWVAKFCTHESINNILGPFLVILQESQSKQDQLRLKSLPIFISIKPLQKSVQWGRKQKRLIVLAETLGHRYSKSVLFFYAVFLFVLPVHLEIILSMFGTQVLLCGADLAIFHCNGCFAFVFAWLISFIHPWVEMYILWWLLS